MTPTELDRAADAHANKEAREQYPNHSSISVKRIDSYNIARSSFKAGAAWREGQQDYSGSGCDKLARILSNRDKQIEQLQSEIGKLRSSKVLMAIECQCEELQSERARLLAVIAEAKAALMGGSERGGVFWRENAIEALDAASGVGG